MQKSKMDSEVKLLSVLVKIGRISEKIAREAEAAVKAADDGVSVIDWLARNDIISEEDFARAIAEHLRLPYVNLATVAPNSAVIELVREELAIRHQIIPLRAPDGTLVVATANPLDREALRAIEFATGRRVTVEVTTPTALRDALEHAYHLEEALNAYLKDVPDDDTVPVADLTDEGTDVRSLLRGTTLPPVVKLFNLILLEGVRNGASDIHIEPSLASVQVRYRTDGVLEESFKLPKWVQNPLTARCKVMASLDITERRVPQDGRIRLNYRETMIDLRVSSLPTQFGEKLTMRILDGSVAPSSLDSLGVSARDLKCMRYALARPEGMVLVTGPTGSGKSTTLYSMITEIISPMRNIVTIENPIEYQIRGVNQVEINEKQGLTFASALRSILRQDPDVILLGEIRDQETAEIALRAAQTGHLVLSTLHTNDTASTITRLLDIGIEPYMLSSSLHLILAQRLVRKNCTRCAEPYEPDPDMLRALQISAGAHNFRRGRGCPACRKSGFSGRTAIVQVMPVSPALAKLIGAKATESELRTQAREDGMHSLFEHAAIKVCEGVTTAEEVLRVVDVPTAAARCPACSKTIEDTFAMCPHCGKALQSNCSGCGMKMQTEWQMCPYCGVGKRPAAITAVPVPPVIPTPVAQETASSLRQYHALVVDDQPDMRRLVTFALEHSGMPISVVAASSGHEAIERSQNDPPDLIILELMMPDMDGFEVCERLRSNVRTAFVPILMLTALDDPNNRARGFMAGTDDYIGKPFTRGDLLARVRRLLQRTYGAVLPDLRRPIATVQAAPDAGDANRMSA